MCVFFKCLIQLYSDREGKNWINLPLNSEFMCYQEEGEREGLGAIVEGKKVEVSVCITCNFH